MQVHTTSARCRRRFARVARLTSLGVLGVLVCLTGCLATRHSADRSNNIAIAEQRFASGDLRGATAAFAEAARSAPTAYSQAEGFLGLGRCEHKAGNPRRALQYLQRASTIFDQTGAAARYGEVLYYQGEAYIELDSYRNAQQVLERAFTYLGESELRAKTAYLLVLLCDSSHDHAGARRYRAFASRLDPQARELTYWREKIRPVPHHNSSDRATRAAEPPKIAARPANPTKLRIHKRSEWGARKMRRNASSMGKVRAITVHHTGEDGPQQVGSSGQVGQYLKRLQRYVQNEKKWADIGYHYLIDPRGEVWEGRPAKYQGAHAGNPTLNKGNLGVAVIGNFETTKPTAAQLRTLERLLADLARQHKVPLSRVYTHSQRRRAGGLGDTICPGRFLARRMPTILRGLAHSGIPAGSILERRLAGAASPCPCCPDGYHAESKPRSIGDDPTTARSVDVIAD